MNEKFGIAHFLVKWAKEDTNNEMREDLMNVIDYKNKHTPISQVMNLSDRVLRQLANNGIYTIGNLSEISKAKLMFFRCIGKAKVRKLEEAMEQFEVKFLE